MTKEIQTIKKTTENFFNNLKCEISWKDNLLIIENVPKDFQKLYKNPPYYFSFDEITYQKNPDSELITIGSTFPKIMSTYLEKKGKTTLIKLNFNNIKQDLNKQIDFNDFKIHKISESINYDLIFRFIFLTNFQYLNEKEQITNEIYLKDKKILDNFNLKDFPTTEGKKSDISDLNISNIIKDNYIIAKDNLKNLISPKTKEISIELNDSLDHALKRVNTHYDNLLDEIISSENKNKSNINLLKEKLNNADEKNKTIIQEKINKLIYTSENSNHSMEIEKLKKEKEFFINDEKNKHSIDLKNSLINTTLVYYPKFRFNIFVKNKNNLLKEISLSYNPLTEVLSNIFCESCNLTINKINICSKNHLTCNNCMTKCPRCAKIICKSCKIILCNICSGYICENCVAICKRCNKPTCNQDIIKDNITNNPVCKNCIEFCTSCKKYTSKNYIKKCSICKYNFCINCLKDRFVNNTLQPVCKTCTPKVLKKPKIDDIFE